MTVTGLKRHAEHFLEAARAGGGNVERAAVARACEPSKIEASRRERRADRAAEMKPPLGPIEARTTEDAPAVPHRVEVDAEILEESSAAFRELAAFLREEEVTALTQRIGKRNAEPAGEVIVASARGSHRIIAL